MRIKTKTTKAKSHFIDVTVGTVFSTGEDKADNESFYLRTTPDTNGNNAVMLSTGDSRFIFIHSDQVNIHTNAYLGFDK